MLQPRLCIPDIFREGIESCTIPDPARPMSHVAVLFFLECQYTCMLDAQEIAHRFLDTRLQVHPDVVRYILEQGEPDLIERIIAGVPNDTIVVSAQHIPGMPSPATGPGSCGSRGRSGQRFAGTSGPINGTGDYLHYFRDRYTRLGGMIRSRCSTMPIEALTKNNRYRQEECTIIGMVTEVKTTTNGHRIAEIEDTSANIPVLFRKDRRPFPMPSRSSTMKSSG